MSLLSRSTILRLMTALLTVPMILPAWGADQIVLDGSSGMLPLANALASAYQQGSSDPKIEIGKGLGTGPRLQALADGKIQIALASHGIKGEATPPVKRFLDFALSPEGDRVIRANGAVPLRQ